MPLADADLKHLQAAEGFIALGMVDEADNELESIDPFCRHLPEVLAVRVAIYHAGKRWELLEAVAKRLCLEEPDNPQWPISLAYATRRVRSIAAAREILIEAAIAHSKEPTIHYNLACYDCQLGAIVAAKEHLQKAFELCPEYRVQALDDDDLRPLWDSIEQD